MFPCATERGKHVFSEQTRAAAGCLAVLTFNSSCARCALRTTELVYVIINLRMKILNISLDRISLYII